MALALGLLMVAAAITTSGEARSASDLARQCETELERARLWIRATDPAAPAAEKAKVRAKVEETSAICTEAREAEPTDGRVLVNAAYALFAMGDKPAGVKLIEKAAETGYPPAMVMTARYMGRGEYLEKDAEGAWLMLIQTLKSDHDSARMEAAIEFLPGGVGPESPKRARKVFKELIDAGNGEAMVTYAMKVLKLQQAEGGSDAAKEGIALLERAAREAKNAKALIYLSLFHNQGSIVEKSAEKAIDYARLAVEAGVSRAYATMGQIYQNLGDMPRAIEWFQKGAEADDGFAQGMLGFMHSGGFGTEQDMDKAVEWWTKGRWNGDRLSSSYLQVHREKLAMQKAWEEEKAAREAEKAEKARPKKTD